MPRTLLVAPAARQVGLTSSCLGLVRALDRQGVRVGYAKPFAIHGQTTSVQLVKLGSTLQPPDPIPRHRAEELLAAGDDQTLMEQVVALCNKAGEGADVLIVEGMVPMSGGLYATRVNQLMLKALDAELVLVGAPGTAAPAEAASSIAIAARGFGGPDESRSVSCILNFVPASAVDAFKAALAAEKLAPVAVIPTQDDLMWPRVRDVAAALGAGTVHAGEADLRRVREVRLCAMTAANSIRAFVPGALIVTPGDRDDIIMAASLATLGGLQLAGLVLTGGVTPSPRVLELCAPAFATGLPVLAVEGSSIETAQKLGEMDKRIPPDDKDRVERAMTSIADRVDAAWLKSLVETKRVKRLSPPAFRYQLIEAARAANKRIVLPEGDEPRTIAAAAIVQERGIARCALIGKPDQIHAVAEKQGLKLPASVEIIDPASAAPRYVEPLLERRRSKGMTAEIAQSELQDTIMIGTMMMALDEADGLVSGAVHTTAHTIRPALQLIKTAPGCNLVSSVFFMCLPDQVLVFGDCAVNPNPTAEQLADIAIQSADSAAAFGIPPRVAMLSYSTGTSGGGQDVEKVKKATDLAKAQRPDLAIDGPLQYDAAVMPDVGRSKAPKSPVAGKATVLIFPDLNTGNVTYKAVQRSANVVSMGPMLQGLAKPVNDLSRGCLVEDIVFTIVLTAIQAEQAAARKKA